MDALRYMAVAIDGGMGLADRTVWR